MLWVALLADQMHPCLLTTTTPNRWMMVAAGVLMQIALGAVFAWSESR